MRKKRNGMTLMEVMFGALLVAVAFVSIAAMARSMLRTAYDNLADGVALHSATGIMEQTKIQLFPLLQKATSNTTAMTLGQAGSTQLDYYYYDDVKRVRSYFSLQPNYRYITDANADAAAANKASQVPNVYLSVRLNADGTFDTANSVPMDMEIVSLNLIDNTLLGSAAPGVVMQLTYRYRAAASNAVYKNTGQWNPGTTPWRVRVLKTFVPQSF